MKQFTMSQYLTLEDLYKAKAEYWEAIAKHYAAFTIWSESGGVDPTEEQINEDIEDVEGSLGL